ncbi:MAG: methyltransferase domain-containing protein [Verrucomicrobia bacterium]|nr:methyltransferase domain-containing protein [Verrucomicrobiota bacterium]
MDRLITTASERFWFAEAYARDQWVKAQAAKLAKGSAVLDAGAGASKYRPFFGHCNYKTQDFCLYQGPLVKYLEPIDYVCEITSIPLPNGSLDAILCTEVIEHVVNPMAVLAEFHRLLKPGGKLLLTAPLLSHIHMEPYHYYGGFTHFWYEYWLPRNGFTIEATTCAGGPARTCVTFCQAFYASWSEAEKKLKPLPRMVSLPFRAAAKVAVHYVLPFLLPKFDPWLGSRQIYSTCMVAAIRNPGEK